MANVPGTDRAVNTVTYGSYGEPQILRRTTDYFIRLLVERHAIRSALESAGGSVVYTSAAARLDADMDHGYSSMVGNDLHLDLLEAERIVNELPCGQRQALLDWVDGLPVLEAAHYSGIKPGSIRVRRHRAKERAGQMWVASCDQEEKDLDTTPPAEAA